MFVTVGICTRNRSKQLDRALHYLAQLVVPEGMEWELLVVNNNSTDDTDQVIRRYESRLPLRKLFERRHGKSFALNRAAQKARGEYILWTDDDGRVDPEWLQGYCRAFREWPQAVAFGGPIEVVLEGNSPLWLRQTLPLLRRAYAYRNLDKASFRFSRQHAEEEWLPFGCNCAVRIKEQRDYPYDPRLGLWPGHLIGGEEIDVFQRMIFAGLEVRWVPEAKVTHFILRERQNLRYLRERLMGYEKRVALMWNGSRNGKNPPPSWKKVLEAEWTFRWHRLVKPPEIWVQDFITSSRLWGKFLYQPKFRAPHET